MRLTNQCWLIGLALQFVLFSLVLHTPTALAVTLYKCQTEAGKLVYKDTPCAAKDEQISSKQLLETEPVFKQPDAELFISKQQFQAVLAQLISNLQIVKLSIVEYWYTNGDWPTSLAALGFNAANMTSSNIERLKLGQRGKIVAVLATNIGNNIMLEMTPQLVMDQTSVEWKYTSNLPDNPLDASPKQPMNMVN